ncbi:MAG: hypothetical protein WC714_18850 [Candidatus Obscuribacterales bacterium]|jgi:hypothetical protein
MNLFPILLLLVAIVLYASMDSPNMRFYFRIRERKTVNSGPTTRTAERHECTPLVNKHTAQRNSVMRTATSAVTRTTISAVTRTTRGAPTSNQKLVQRMA